MTTTRNTPAPRNARWYSGSSAETITKRELDSLMRNYRDDGAEVTRSRDGSMKVRLPDGETRSYSRATRSHSRTR